jgi:hypothetical protein
MFPVSNANSGVEYIDKKWTCGAKSSPVMAPYIILGALVGGVVKGSVSMTKAKNNKDEFNMIPCRDENKPTPADKSNPRVTTIAATKKDITKSNLWIFLTISNPPISTNGAIEAVPTHQVADCPIAKEVIATAKAAGLKICFRFKESIYFEAMAIIAAHPRNHK